MVKLSVDTGDHAPVQQQPYSVPMALRERESERRIGETVDCQVSSVCVELP